MLRQRWPTASLISVIWSWAMVLIGCVSRRFRYVEAVALRSWRALAGVSLPYAIPLPLRTIPL